MRATTTQINMSSLKTESEGNNPRNIKEKPPRYSQPTSTKRIARQNLNIVTEKKIRKPKRPVTATYRRVENADEGSVKHQIKFLFK